MTILFLILFAIGVLFVFLEDFLDERSKSICYVIMCVLMILLPATKSVIDTPDAMSYEDMFYGTNTIVELMTEPSFLLISNILKNSGYTITALFAIYATINIGIKGSWIYKMTPFPILTLFIYLSYLYILHDLIQIRVGAALAFGLVSLYNYCNDRKWGSLVFIAIAVFFHYSAILLVLFFLFDNKPLTLKWKIALYCIVPFGLLLCVLRLNLLSLIPSFVGGEKIDLYKDLAENGEMDDASLLNPILWIKILAYLTSLWFYDFLRDKNQYLSLFIKLMGLSILIELSLLYTNAVMAYRLSELFNIVDPFVITTLVYLFNPSWLGRSIIVFVSALSVAYCIFVLHYILT